MINLNEIVYFISTTKLVAENSIHANLSSSHQEHYSGTRSNATFQDLKC